MQSLGSSVVLRLLRAPAAARNLSRRSAAKTDDTGTVGLTDSKQFFYDFFMSEKSHIYFVYILFSKNAKVLYIGVTNDIARRMWEYKNKINKKSFPYRYNVDKLGYFEIFGDIDLAIAREKQLKGGSHDDKLRLIMKMNPKLEDLSNNLNDILFGQKGAELAKNIGLDTRFV